MKIKKFLAVVMVFVVLLSFAACAPEAKDETTAAKNETTQAADGTTAGDETTAAEDTTAALCDIKVTVVHKDGTQKVLEYSTSEAYLGALLQAEGVIEGNDGPYGLVISTVDGEKAVYEEDKAYWALYENGEYALQGIDTTPITDGGEYKLEYTPA